MKKLSFSLALMFLLPSLVFAQNAGRPGGFARLGFGARGMGMGNALTAVSSGSVQSYYNPALSAVVEQRTGAATFGVLSLDRYLNFLSYTQSIAPTGGLSVGIINAGVRGIDGRNSNGVHTEDYYTSENQFFVSFANRMHERFSLGLTVKLYYSRLFEEITSSTVGFDIGAYVQLAPQLSLCVAVQDIGSKYTWDTAPIYEQDGKQSKDKFPMLRRVGLAYALPSLSGTVSVEFENSSEGTNVFRVGAEYQMIRHFTLRGGLDRSQFDDRTSGAKPTFGFSLANPFSSWTPTLDYAFIVEPFSPSAMHIVTLAVSF